ncbi:TetR/AcrR family transcriptional regulator [Catenuloplanes japonicus]|uniref:TetR/AcrR family transcriptional regulator n=1 Tax=Catenuloplanes japonicus TaxID=33876 RepID=UPI0018DDBC7F|nr:TetR/AcrR family transcriptional regulator [Catenuloplanes japonicus]
MKGTMRERIVTAATELFYAQGLRAVSADRVIEQVGTTKVTFYRHFRSKDDLIVAYLERRAAWEREGIAQEIAQAGGDLDATLRRIADGIGATSCSPGFRGCPFINAAAEYPDPAHPVRQVVDAHRRWYLRMFESLLAPLQLGNGAETAADLVLLRDGAMVTGYLGDPAVVAGALYRSAQAVIAYARGA